jgi:hypothetical protein
LGGILDYLGTSNINEMMQPADWQTGAFDDWKQFIGPQVDALQGYLQGVNPALEGLIAGQRNAASTRIAGGLAGKGTVNTGARALLEQSASNRATQQTAEARLGTQQMGIQGLGQLSGQHAGLTGQYMNLRSPMLQTLLGWSPRPMFPGWGSQTGPLGITPGTENQPEGQGYDMGNQGGGGQGQGTNDQHGYLPPGCHREFDANGQPISVCN